VTAHRATPAPIRSVLIERRGGVGGLHVRAKHDYATLTTAQRRAVDELLAHPASPAPAAGADRFSYRISCAQADGAQRVIDVDEDAMPAPLEELVRPRLPGDR
jgi:hypothetical protein